MKNIYDRLEKPLGIEVVTCGFEPDSVYAQELFDYETFFAQLLAVEFATRVTS